MSQWRGFELLAEQIYAEVDTRAEVKWNDYIKGYDSEISRQIDVSIRWADSGREHLAIVQVKDWKTPADIVAVGEFSSTVRDVRADKGVMVCRSGFSGTAKTYARNIGLELHNLHDAQSKNWNRNLTIPILWQEQDPHFDIRVRARMEAGDTVDPERFGAIDFGSAQRDVQEDFIDRWNRSDLARTPELIHIYDPGGPVFISARRPDGSSVLRPTAELELGYRVIQKSWLGQFEPTICRGYVDYLQDESFTVSYLPVGEVPTRRDEGWALVRDPARIAVRVAGSLVTTQQFGINSAAQETSLDMRRIGP